MKTNIQSENTAPRRLPGFSSWLAAALMLLCPLTTQAVPSFARQLNVQCTACHTEFPILNQFARTFKLNGYVAQDDSAPVLPLAAMAMPSYTHTATDQAGGAAPGFSPNDNFAFTQISLFYSGRLFGNFGPKDSSNWLNKIGIFSQTTYDGIGKAWHIDNTELRYADTATIAGHDAIYGFYLNNNPTLQDPWNTIPAWGYPFSGSGLAPTPTAATLIEGGLAQQVYGVGGYLFLNDSVYLDVGGYSTLPYNFQKSTGIDPTGEAQIPGFAPYVRVAMERMVGDGRLEAGLFFMSASTYPGRDQSAGKDKTVDFGVDSQYQWSRGPHDVTGLLTFISEHQSWDASSVLGNTSNTSDDLRTFHVTMNYLYDKTYGATVQYFQVNGDSDPILYSGSATGSPDSSGYVFQLNYLPFNKGGGPAFWPRSNVKLSLQYRYYTKFDGGSTNYDGAGANAHDNNTLYLEAWIAF